VTDETASKGLPSTRLLLVRHGESNVSVKRQVGGPQTCSGLSELGRMQAQRLRDRIGSGEFPEIDELWASTMPRAIETASIVNEALNLDLQLEEEFEEFRPGEADGMLFSEYVDRFGMPDHMAEPFRLLAPGGESRASFFLRVGTAMAPFLDERAGKTVMVVCHAGVIDLLFRQLLGVGSETPFHLWTLNTSVTEFMTASHGPPRQWCLGRYNDAAHLHGLPAATEPE